jgi:hypothetical protein
MSKDGFSFINQYFRSQQAISSRPLAQPQFDWLSDDRSAFQLGAARVLLHAREPQEAGKRNNKESQSAGCALLA